MILKNIKTSVRNLKKNKLHTFLGIFGFAAGFSICLIIGLFVYDELTVDSYPENHAQIYRLFNTETNSADIDYRLNETLSNDYPSIENTCPIFIPSNYNVVASTDASSIYIKGVIATNNEIFEMLSIKVLKSNSSNPFADKNSSIITASTAKKIFGDRDPLGEKLKVESNETTVSAIIADFPSNSSITAAILLNSENPNFRLNSAFALGEIFNYTNHYIVLNKNESKTDLEKTINKTIGTIHKTIKNISLQPLKSIYLDTTIKDGNKHGNTGLIKIISVIGILILLLSIINYINYILSLQFKRMKEIGIKKVNGATTGHIISYYLSDIFIWITIAFIFSQIIIQFSLPFFNQVFQEDLKIQTLYSLPFLVSILLTLISIIVISCIPLAILLSKFNFQNFLNNTIFRTKSKILNSFLPIFQLSISILLIIGVLIIQKQLFYAKHKDLGFNENALLHINVPYKALDATSFKNELLKSPSIKKVTLSSGVPGSRLSIMTNPKWDFTLHQMDIDEDFIETMQIELLEGRNISHNDKKQGIVNEATLKAFELEKGTENKIEFGGNHLEIVGIVKDFQFGSIHEKIEPLILKYGINRSVSIRMSGNNMTETMDYIHKTWRGMTSNIPIKYEFYDSKFDAMYKKEEQLAYACSLFSIIAIIITCLGLLGQVLFLTDKKTKEIGIRKVNGATINEIMFMLNKDFIKWVLIAFVIACPIAYYAMSNWLENFAYKTALSWWVFALAGVFTLIIALLTVSWQTYRAANRNPVESLRDE